MAETYKQRRQRLAKLQQETTRLKKEMKTLQRKEEARKLIIKGRWVDKLLELGLMTQEYYQTNMDKFLTRNVDRELFGFPLLPEPNVDHQQPTAAKKSAKKTDSPPKTPPDVAVPPDPPPPPTTDQHPPSATTERKLPEYDQKLEEAFDL
jgi:hypothetical protein